MAEKGFLEALKKANKNKKAKYPVAVAVLKSIPHFIQTFSEDEKILKSLAQLEDERGTPYIRYKTFKPNEIIIRKGRAGKTVFWLMKGEAQVKSENRVLTHIKPITCFGELSVVNSQDRKATVQVTNAKPAVVLVIDWAITVLAEPLADGFNELLLKNSTEKLKTGYVVSERLWKSANNLLAASKKRIEKLEKENENLKKQNKSLKNKLSDIK